MHLFSLTNPAVLFLQDGVERAMCLIYVEQNKDRWQMGDHVFAGVFYCVPSWALRVLAFGVDSDCVAPAHRVDAPWATNSSSSTNLVLTSFPVLEKWSALRLSSPIYRVQLHSTSLKGATCCHLRRKRYKPAEIKNNKQCRCGRVVEYDSLASR